MSKWIFHLRYSPISRYAFKFTTITRWWRGCYIWCRVFIYKYFNICIYRIHQRIHHYIFNSNWVVRSRHIIAELEIQDQPHRLRETSAIPKLKKAFNRQNKRQITTNRILKSRSLKFSTFKFTQRCCNLKEPT